MSQTLHFYVTGASGGLGLNLVENIRLKYPNAFISCQFNSNSSTNLLGNSRLNHQKVNVLHESQVSDSIAASVIWGGTITNLVVCHGIWPSKTFLWLIWSYQDLKILWMSI
jgi:hypothetical protein